ncbi:diguanylate cyclase [Lentzea tibetensis]|nr:diguanylate cyclase [Lentzea tibetensis]
MGEEHGGGEPREHTGVDEVDLPRCGSCAQPVGSWDTDRLTGLLDRWGWDDKAPAVFRRAQRRWEDLALLLIDLDWFKKINDELGHPAGDSVLKEIADVLLRSTRREDLVGRHGGDEFLVLLPHTSLAEAVGIAERALDGIQAIQIGVRTNTGTDVVLRGLTASIGLAAYAPNRNHTLMDLIRDTDAALQRAKATGRGRIHVHDPSGSEQVQAPPARAVPTPRWSTVEKKEDLRTLLNLRHLVNSDWMPDVLQALTDGPKHYGDLLAAIRSTELINGWSGRNRNVQKSVLNRTLRRLEDNGFVLRHEEPGVWPRAVRYELGPAAQEWLSDVLPAVSRWCHRHDALITRAQRLRRHNRHLGSIECVEPHDRDDT